MSDKNSKPVGPADGALDGKIDYDEIRKLIGLLEEKNLSVFELEVEGLKVKIARNSAPIAPVMAPAQAELPAAPTPEAAAAAEALILAAEAAKGHHLVTSPMVGTFYRAPDPTSAPFTDIGETVKKGQTLCIIEAMKLMNEIEADVDGTVVDVYVENAKPVEFGQKLFAIMPES
ncbi:MAG TPA: acetyl-CoA carboxylase biotin carboxyl carrier protein [Candidatus Aminicenantes bacterium]|nr:acetyl-CoA carboxylase biotin carboxyl carrier protein [Candidatus Aminicenantes bacterium]HDT13919.1 acetyl-CoA carboxylase biotin carboxyl carrier protein [Candidatus Aminicenantes bacterium]